MSALSHKFVYTGDMTQTRMPQYPFAERPALVIVEGPMLGADGVWIVIVEDEDGERFAEDAEEWVVVECHPQCEDNGIVHVAYDGFYDEADAVEMARHQNGRHGTAFQAMTRADAER